MEMLIYLTAIVIAMLAFIAVLDAIRGSMARFRPAGWIAASIVMGRALAPADQSDLERTLGDVSIQPGIPTEVFVRTGTHTLRRYFPDPIVHSFNRAFREEVMN